MHQSTVSLIEYQHGFVVFCFIMVISQVFVDSYGLSNYIVQIIWLLQY